MKQRLWVWVTLVSSSLTCSHADPHFLWSLTLTNLSLPPSRRCEEPGEFSPGRERPGAGQRSAAGLRHVQLPAANGQVWPAAPSATRDTSHQPASRRIPLLQTPERRRALQQPAYWNAARQKSLGSDFPTRSAAVQFCSSPEIPNNAFTKTKPPAHTWLCGDLEDGEQSLYRALFCVCVCGSSYNLRWTNTCTETHNVHRQTAFGSLYCRKKKKHNKNSKKELLFLNHRQKKTMLKGRKKEKTTTWSRICIWLYKMISDHLHKQDYQTVRLQL